MRIEYNWNAFSNLLFGIFGKTGVKGKRLNGQIVFPIKLQLFGIAFSEHFIAIITVGPRWRASGIPHGVRIAQHSFHVVLGSLAHFDPTQVGRKILTIRYAANKGKRQQQACHHNSLHVPLHQKTVKKKVARKRRL